MEEGTELPALPAVPTKSQKGHTDIAGPTNESNWVIPGKVLAGAYPGDRKEPSHSEKIELIVSTGVTAFVCLQSERELQKFTPYKEIVSEKLKQKWQGHKEGTFIHQPIPGSGVIEDEKVMALVESIVQLVLIGEIVYIHCHGGHGRTGTIVGCLLARLYKLSPEEALAFTAGYHQCRRKRTKAQSPQTAVQFDQVRRIALLYSKSTQPEQP